MSDFSSLPNHMRIAALQCNFEGGLEKTLKVADLWKEYGFNVEQLFHTHCQMYSAVFDKDKHSEVLSSYLEKTKFNNIAVILYMNCHILLDSQKDMWNQWAQINNKCEYTVMYGTYKACCVNSSWTDYFLSSIKSLKGFGISGIFLDGPVCLACYCKSCQQKYQNLYTRLLTDASKDEIDEFTIISKIDFLKKVYGVVKETNPDWFVYNNLGLLHSKVSALQMKQILDFNDIVGTEGGFQFGGEPKDVDIWRCGVNAKMVESVAANKPKVIFVAGDHKPWSWYMHTAAETKLVYASTIANGCSAWYGIHGSTDLLASSAGLAARHMVEYDRKYSNIYENSESIADIGLFFSFETYKSYTSTGEITDLYTNEGLSVNSCIGNYSDSFYGAFDLLFQNNAAFDIITELSLDKLCKYSVLIIPTGACMSSETAEKIIEYVRNGGVLICDSETSLYDCGFKRRKNFGLYEILGSSFKGYLRYNPHDYFELQDLSYLNGESIKYIPAPVTAIDIDVSSKAQIDAKLYAPLAGRYAGKPQNPQRPLLIKNQVSKGFSYYFAGTYFELFRKYGITHYRKIIHNLIKKHSSPPVELVNSPASVEFTIRKIGNSNNIIVHLINYTSAMTRPIENIVPLYDIKLKLKINVKKAKSLTCEKPLSINNNEIVIEKLNEFEVILLEL